MWGRGFVEDTSRAPIKDTLMTIGDIAVKARFDTNTDSTSYTDANLLINLNVWWQKIATMILESQDESDFDDGANTTNYPVYKRVLANRRDYAFSTAAWQALGKEGGANASAAAILPLKVKRLDISYDGVHFYKATPLDDGEVTDGMGNDSDVDQNYSRYYPRYDVKNNSVFIYPMPTAADVTAGAYMQLETERNVTPFTSADLSTGTLVPGFDAPFHPMLADGASLEYAISRQLPQMNQLQQRITDWEQRLRQAYSRKQLDRRIQITPWYSPVSYL